MCVGVRLADLEVAVLLLVATLEFPHVLLRLVVVVSRGKLLLRLRLSRPAIPLVYHYEDYNDCYDH